MKNTACRNVFMRKRKQFNHFMDENMGNNLKYVDSTGIQHLIYLDA